MLSVEDSISKADLDLGESKDSGLGSLTTEERQELLIQTVSSYRGKKFFVTLLILNFILLYVRPQDFVPGLGALRLPIFLSWIAGLCWIAKGGCGNWTIQIKVMLAFLFFEGLRGFVGKFVLDSFVINDFWAINVWFDLVTQFFGIVFPIVAFFDSGPALRRFTRSLIFAGFFLGLFGITHHGTGPGAFLGDENDLGCGLLMLLPFALTMLTEGGPNAGSKFFFAVSAVFTFGGILATFSRGTFVGLVAMLLIFIWRSKKKLALIVTGAFVVLLALPFAPPGYITEMGTINNQKDETADFRKHYWKLATRAFLDPHNIAIGVGLKNTPYVLGHYETAEDLRKFPSAAGRVTHSIYFQLLPDLGIWGILVVGSLLMTSGLNNFRIGKDFRQLWRRSRNAILTLNEQESDVSDPFPVDSPSSGNFVETQQRDTQRLLWRIGIETQFIRALATGTNVSFVGVMASGAFIDILYYPHVWILVGISSVLQIYSKRIMLISNAIIEDLLTSNVMIGG